MGMRRLVIREHNNKILMSYCVVVESLLEREEVGFHSNLPHIIIASLC